jgi:uncharacterized protein (DUF1501 family)
MKTTRRDFLGVGAAGLSFVSLGGSAPRLFERAAAASTRADANDHVLIVLELAGGNDGLNTVIPFEDAHYYRNRRTLGIPKKDVHKLTDKVGLHPRMGPLAELYKQGRVAVVQGVGYPGPDRSHFRSMEIWHTATTAPRPTAGWLGKFLDATATPDNRDALLGLALGGALPQAFQAEKSIVPVVHELESLAGDEAGPQGALLRTLSASRSKADDALAFLRTQAETAYRTAERIKKATSGAKTEVEYPEGELGDQLRRAAQIIVAGLGVRVLFVSQDGFDTHANQADQQGQLLETLAKALAAFDRDLHARKLAERVAVMVFSEFGRRVDENASRGTDHGAGSCMFAVGAKVQGGLAGQYPSLERLGEGDLIFNTDFRSVYATLLDGWLGCPSEPILGQKFPTLNLLQRNV